MNQVLIIFIILVVGVICRVKNILTKEITKGLSHFLMSVVLPFNIISSFNQTLPSGALVNAGYIFGFAFLIHTFSMLLGKILYRNCEDGTRKVMWFITVFSNCGFMGFPVLESIFGKIGVFYGSVYIVVFNLFQFTFGQMLFTGEKDAKALKNALSNPGILSVFIGLILFFSPVKLPYVAYRVVDMIGSTTTPLAMIIVGSMLAEVNIKEVFSGIYMYYGIAIRLLVLPIIILYALKFSGVTGNVFIVCCMLSAMPAAANSVIFAERFDGDSVLASKIVFISTVFSIVTIPLITLLL
jgi:predicted permease